MVAPTLQCEKPKEKEIATLPEVAILTDVPLDEPEPVWSRRSLVVAAFGFLCCNLLGLPALIFSIFSYVDHHNKQYGESTRKQRHARRLGIAAIILGTLLLGALIAWHFCPERKKKAQEKLAAQIQQQFVMSEMKQNQDEHAIPPPPSPEMQKFILVEFERYYGHLQQLLVERGSTMDERLKAEIRDRIEQVRGIIERMRQQEAERQQN